MIKITKKIVSLHNVIYKNIIHINELLVISTSIDFIRIPYDELLFVAAEGNYSTLTTIGDERLLVNLQLGQIEQMLVEQLPAFSHNFVRIGKSLIANLKYVRYVNVPKQKLALYDKNGRKYQLMASSQKVAFYSLFQAMGGRYSHSPLFHSHAQQRTCCYNMPFGSILTKIFQ